MSCLYLLNIKYLTFEKDEYHLIKPLLKQKTAIFQTPVFKINSILVI